MTNLNIARVSYIDPSNNVSKYITFRNESDSQRFVCELIAMNATINSYALEYADGNVTRVF